MKCPKCGAKSKTLDSRQGQGRAWRRRRQCLRRKCKLLFSTMEVPVIFTHELDATGSYYTGWSYRPWKKEKTSALVLSPLVHKLRGDRRVG